MAEILGGTTKVIGKSGYVAAAAGTYLDYKAMQSGEISGGRFSYRTVGTGIGLGVGISFGAIPGAVVGGLSWAGEQMYDGAVFAIDKIGQFFDNVENAMRSGTWLPGQ